MCQAEKWARHSVKAADWSMNPLIQAGDNGASQQRRAETADRPIRIVLVDDHSVFRAGLRMIIRAQHNMMLVAEAGNCQEALAAAAREQPDLILLDLDLGQEDGTGLIPDLLAAASRARIIVLTGVREAALHRRAVLLGALGIVRKEKAPDELINAIERVSAGEAWLDTSLMADVIGEVSRKGRAAQPDPEAARIASLTPREREVITCFGEGLSTKEVAERLFISEKTVGHHLGSIFSKLGVGSRSEMIVYAYRHQLAELPA